MASDPIPVGGHKRDELEPLRVVLGALHGRPDNAPDVTEMARVVEALTPYLALMCVSGGFGELVIHFAHGQCDKIDLKGTQRVWQRAS